MGLLNGRLTLQGSTGRVWPLPHKPKRSRFCAWFERGMDIEVRHFPTRTAAHEWLKIRATKGTHE